MNTKLTFGVVALVLAVPAVASAQETSFWRETVPAPTRALELTVATGYTQPFGYVRSGQNIADLVGPGAGFDLGVGYRIIPNLSVGLTGQYHESQANGPNGSAVRGGFAGIDGTFHVAPEERTDPWFQLGVGYRMLWTVNPGMEANVLDHGFELARVMAGIDLRGDRALALGPMVGADLNLFLWQRPEGGTTVALTDPRVSTFVFAGIQGRFDASREEVPSTVARR